MIKVENVTKKFNDFTAIDNLNLEISEGEIFGLLGENGAGKTTTLRILATMLKPTQGKATVRFASLVRRKMVRIIMTLIRTIPRLFLLISAKMNVWFRPIIGM